MRIGIDARMFSATGIGRYIQELLKNLSKIDNKNEYFIFLKKADMGIGLPANFHEVEADIHWYTLKEQIMLPRILHRYDLDLVHFLHYSPVFFNGKYVSTIHDLTLFKFDNVRSSVSAVFYPLKKFIFKLVLKNTAKKSVLVISPSIATSEDISKILGIRDKIRLIYEGADHLQPMNTSRNTSANKFIFYLGNAYPYKNLERLIQATGLINKEVKLNLVIAGEKDDFMKKIERLYGNERFLEFKGYVDDQTLGTLYSSCAAFVFPSLSEGFGLPPLEAMTYGIPVISSNASCLPEILGDAAIYFDPTNVDEMASQITKVLTDTELRKELITKGYEQVKKYSWERMAKQTLDVYKEALGL